MMKAAILTCNTGQGHNSVSKSIDETLKGRGIECEVIDTLSFAGKYTFGIVSGLYSKMITITPQVFGVMYRAGDIMSGSMSKSPVYYANSLYAENLYRFLIDNSFDTAICPHLFPAEALTYLRRHKGLSIGCYMIMTDYTCIPFLEETDMDAIFIPHEDLTDEFVCKGLQREKLVCTGIPVLQKFRKTTAKEEARAVLGIDRESSAFLVIGGGEGCGNFLKLTQKLIEYGDDRTRVVVLTGRNNRLRGEIDRRYGDYGCVKAVVFNEQVQLYMDACDVILTKPGGLTSTEASVKNIPIIHTNPTSGCETRNARFFTERGLSVMAADENTTAKYAVTLAGDSGAKSEMLKAQRRYINRCAAEDICDYIYPQSRIKREEGFV